MTTYYVRTSVGNDGNDGLSAAAAHAWKTIDHAANVVAAGDTVYIGAGVYRETVTMDTPGAAGSQISYIGDFDGSQTGDAGLVIITAYDDDQGTGLARADALILGQMEFIVWKNVIVFGGTNGPAVNSSGAADVAYEGVEFHNCTLQSGPSSPGIAIQLTLNKGATPATTGLLVSQCTLLGNIAVDRTNNAVAHVNLKWNIKGCIGLARPIGNTALVFFTTTTISAAYSAAGVTIANCLAVSMIQGLISDTGNKNTANPCIVANSVAYGCAYAITGSSTAGATVAYDCIAALCAGAPFASVTDYNCRVAPALFAGLHDSLWLKTYGWSPWKAWEPMSIAALFTPFGLNQSHPTYTPANDLQDTPFLSQRGGLYYGYMDGADGVSDPNSKWSSEAYAVDSDYNHSTAAIGTTAGTKVLNYMLLEGAYAKGSASTISQVRFRAKVTTPAGTTLDFTFYTNGAAEELSSHSLSGLTAGWGAWATITAPAGGWTWAVLQHLEARVYKTGGAGTMYCYHIQLEVTCGAEGSLGAVTARNRPAKETGTPHSGVNAMHFTGAGWHDLLIPVNAVATTVTVYGRFDSNYGGASKPQMIAMNIPGVADQTATMVAAANTWEQLSISFTPTAQGICRVRLKSRDTSPNGLCIFDDLRRA